MPSSTPENEVFSLAEAMPSVKTAERILNELKHVKMTLPAVDPDDEDRRARFIGAPAGRTIAVLGEHHGDVASLKELHRILARMVGIRKKQILVIVEDGKCCSLEETEEKLMRATGREVPNIAPGAMFTAEEMAHAVGIPVLKIIPTTSNMNVMRMAAAQIAKIHPQITFEDVIAFQTLIDYMNSLHHLPPAHLRKTTDHDVFIGCARTWSGLSGIDAIHLSHLAQTSRTEIQILVRCLGGEPVFRNLYAGREISNAGDVLTVSNVTDALQTHAHALFIAIFSGSDHTPSIMQGVRKILP